MKYICLMALACLLSPTSFGQKKEVKNAFPTINEGLSYRCIGPFRGGRSAAVTGVPGKPMLFYMGATGGGVWKTTNGGSTWENISDGYFGGSIGSIAVSESHPNILYVGGGEVTVRGNVSYGYGVWKSRDGGRTWKSMGLPDSRHIPKIRIHPRNPDIAYAAVLGDLFKGTEERGVYKTTDGGETWKRVLFSNEDAGAVDLILDPEDPEIIYASTWNVRRTPHSFSSGGEGSALWKSMDGGLSWKQISKNEGFPTGTLGIIGVAVSPVRPNRVWAIVENENGGVYRSEDGGETWKMVNNDRALRQRAWYYSRIVADSQDENKVYVMNVAYHTSTDGGRTFKARYAPHGDHHDLWVAPEDPNRLIIADDGGAQISYDGGDSWSTYQNQPTIQFYRVTTDNQNPYYIYGAQQDNSTLRVSSRTGYGHIDRDDWEATAGGESAHIAPDPKNPDIVYAGSYGGYLTKYNHDTRQDKAINIWPDNPIGYGVGAMKYRFQWNFPVFFSPHDPNKLYACSQHVHVSTNGGDSWEVISPDLSRNDTTKLGPSGGPITKDNTGVEYYATIFAAVESPYEKDLLWTGSDDGLIHVSKDGGNNWTNVTPKKLPEWTMINSIEVDPHQKGGLYAVATSYKLGDYAPYIFYTADYGKTWEKRTTGIDESHFTRVVRADAKQKGLLFCGTETMLYVSTDSGKNWKPFQLNLPEVPITDLAIKNDELIVATQGRSFWMFDDLNVVRQEMKASSSDEKMRLFAPAATDGIGGNDSPSLTAGQNRSRGLRVFFHLPESEKKEKLQLTFTTMNGDTIRSFSTKAEDEEDQIKVKPGMNLFKWDLRYPKADEFDDLLLWWAQLDGPQIVPGKYQVTLQLGEEKQTQEFTILRDPRTEATQADLQARFNFLMDINQTVDETHDAIRHMRLVRKQIHGLNKRLDTLEHKNIIQAGKDIDSLMTVIENELYQTKLKSNQDMLNFPIKLNNKLAHLSALAEMTAERPTEQMLAVREELKAAIEKNLEAWKKIKEEDIPAYDKMIRSSEVPLIRVED